MYTVLNTAYLRIINVDQSPLLLKVLDQRDGSRLSGVTSVGFEGETQDGDTLPHVYISRWLESQQKQLTFPVMVLKRVSTTLLENLLFW